jgi:hypothetical protein
MRRCPMNMRGAASEAAKQVRQAIGEDARRVQATAHRPGGAANGDLERCVAEAIRSALGDAYAAGRGDAPVTGVDEAALGRLVSEVCAAIQNGDPTVDPDHQEEAWRDIERRMAGVLEPAFNDAYAQGGADALKEAANQR